MHVVDDERFMNHALYLAELAAGRTSPNPMVGAVIVRNGNMVGQGWHKQAGTPHAEIHALNEAGNLAKGATMYVTLEPCSHHGRTGPCADALIIAGIKKVVVAMLDPNPLVSGRGVARLRDAGIEVVEGVLADRAAELNEIFIKWITTNMPFGMIKTAMTLDGKISTAAGSSKWITGSTARHLVHTLRDRYDAILVGIGTVLADDPQLTTRLPDGGKNPIRIIVDTMARTPLHSKVITDHLAATIIAVSPAAPPNRITRLEQTGAEVITVSHHEKGIDLRELFQKLGEKGITSVFIEGGAQINASAFQANIVDKVHWFIAPKIIGGCTAPGPVGGPGISLLDDAYQVENVKCKPCGEDFEITGYIRQREGRDVYRACGRIGSCKNSC